MVQAMIYLIINGKAKLLIGNNLVLNCHASRKKRS